MVDEISRRLENKIDHLKGFAPLISLLLLIAALIFVWHEIEHIQYAQIRSAFHRVPVSSILVAMGLTNVNYPVLIGYE